MLHTSTCRKKSSQKSSFFYNNVWPRYKEITYEILGQSDIFESGKNLGIDCSGFCYKAYKADNELLFESSIISTGTSSLISRFKRMTDKVFIHSDYNMISEGDVILKSGHVRIATGNVATRDGNVISIETIEALGSGNGVIKAWYTPQQLSKYKIYHPFRTSDSFQYDENFIGPLPMEYYDYPNQSFEYIRAAENVKQNVVTEIH